MSELALGGVLIGALVFLVLMGLHIAVALTAVGFAGIWLIRENIDMAMRLMYMSAYNGVADYVFATIPLFVLMGLLVSISNVGKDTFDVAEALLRRLRGGLGVATVAANTVFAAVTGVSIASAAVFTRVAVPEMVAHGYRTSFAAGTVAGSSVLGMMIPPSLLMIIYGVLAEQSIGKLFIAGVIPGFLLAIVFALMIMAMARFTPNRVFDLQRQAELARERRVNVTLTGFQMASKLLPIAALVARAILTPRSIEVSSTSCNGPRGMPTSFAAFSISAGVIPSATMRMSRSSVPSPGTSWRTPAWRRTRPPCAARCSSSSSSRCSDAWRSNWSRLPTAGAWSSRAA
jgi:TRAP-type mannitol/chloroaromatic compound transport system permease large subunit